jgi:hypothetical protein
MPIRRPFRREYSVRHIAHADVCLLGMTDEPLNHGTQYTSTYGYMGSVAIDRLCTPQGSAAGTYAPIGRAASRYSQNRCVICEAASVSHRIFLFSTSRSVMMASSRAAASSVVRSPEVPGFGLFDYLLVRFLRSNCSDLPGSDSAGTFRRPALISSVSFATSFVTSAGTFCCISGFIASAPMPPAMPIA